MSTDNRDLKARLMAEAEEAIEELLAGRREKSDLQLSDIENLVRQAGQKVMGTFTQELAEAETRQPYSDICPECGQKMRYKGQKARHLITETGEVRLERAHYHCPTCRKGVFPPRPSVEAGQDSLQQ